MQDESFPLAPAQLGVWYAQLLDPATPINIAQYVDVLGDLDIGVLQEVSVEAAREFGSTIVRLDDSDGEPRQCVDPTLPVRIPLIDLRGETDPIAAAREWMRTDHTAPVDLAGDRLFAGAVLRVEERRYFWYLRAHHIVVDGYGALLNIRRVAERYTARLRGIEPGPNTAGALPELVERELAYRDSARYPADRDYWADRVDGLDTTTLGGRAAPRTASNRIFGRALPDHIAEMLNACATEHDSTPSMVLLAAFAAYLARMTDREEVVLSLPVTGRTTAVARRSAGMLSNIVPLRVRVGALGWAELLRATRVEVTGALRHQRYRHEDIRRDTGREGSGRGLFGPLANIMLFHSVLTLGDTVGRYHVLSTGPVEDLSLNVYYGDSDRVHLDLEANPHRYDLDELIRQHARFVGYLERLLELDPAYPVDSVEVTTEPEREVSLRIWNATDFEVSAVAAGGARATLVSMFEAQVARTPDAVAVRFAGAPDRTYAQLAAEVDRLAHHLISLGVGPECRVAVHLRRSPELVVAIYAVLAAGAAYLPLDPDHPAERIAHVLDTAEPACVLTTSGEIPESSASIIALDRLDLSGHAAAPVRDRDRTATLRPEHPAYVLFTSGSTGRPKGVTVTHAAIVNRLVWMQRTYRLAADDVVLQKTPATFDVSVWELFWPLQIGATLVVAQPEGHRDPAYLSRVIAEYGVTTVHFVPSMLAAFLTGLDGAAVRSLRRVFASGEVLPAPTARRLLAATPARLHNLYGPTEAAVDVTAHEVTAADSTGVPIGAPVFNTRLYVLDSRLRPVPIGVPGELYLSGVQLARGYVGRPGTTAERFVANPFGDPAAARGSRMYRTGDLVLWTAAGELEYLGRTDFQVKLRGQRIEPEEIEAVLAAEESVARAVVVVRDDIGLGQQLVAYIVENGTGAVDLAGLRAASARRLPAYMVPSAYVVLNALPVNASGKLDRAALPAPAGSGAGYRAPESVVERAVAGVYAEVLDRSRIGLDDDFFVLGGNSLVATRLAARINAELGARVGMREIFAAPTVAALAALIEDDFIDEDAESAPPLRIRPRPEVLPLSPAQQRIWFLNRFERASAAYNMPFVLRMSGPADIAALRGALADVVSRHEVLRTVFPCGDDGFAHQRPGAFTPPDLEVCHDLDPELERFAARGFDLDCEIPVRARLFRLGEQELALAIVLHHIAADGLSLPVLARDMRIAYTARLTGRAPAWEPLVVQYADYTLWHRDRLGAAEDPGSMAAQQLAYWTEALAGAPDQLDLPTDRPRPVVATGRGAVHGFSIPAELHRAAVEVARARGVSLFMLVHTALAALLARLAGTGDIVIGTPVSGRGERELDELIGMFVNTLALRTRIAADRPFAELLHEVRAMDLAAFAHAELPFEQLVEALEPARSRARHPVFQVMLAVAAGNGVDLGLPDLSVRTSTLNTGVAKFDLQLTVTESFVGAGPGEGPAPAGIQAEFAYALDLFDHTTIAGYARWFVRLLAAVVADASVAVADLPILDEPEAQRAIESGRGARVEAPYSTVVDAFRAQARRTPDALAIVDGERRLTYAETAARVDRLARHLHARGVGPESLVVLNIARSAEFVLAACAVLTAGGAYVPVDPDQPEARLRHAIEVARPVCVLTVDDLLDLDRADPPDAEPAGPRPSHLAYVIFTSGSTGVPKGVAVQHGSLVNQIAWITGEYGIDGTDVILFKTPTTFDVSVWELFAPLCRGARLVVAAPGGQRDTAYLVRLIAEHGVTMTSFVPAQLAIFAEAAERGQIGTLRTVFAAGEALTAEVAATLPGVAVHNLYGPTEFTVHATHFRAADGSGPVPIGSPVHNTQAYVLDARLRPVPDLVAGELYLSGAQLARGYLGRPGLTAERFVAGPGGVRLYRTGDLVRRRAGALEYLGRSDFQVKVRGQRIELGEIEAALIALPGVRSAAVRVCTTSAGDLLVASLVTDLPDPEITVAERLRAILPSYLVPTVYQCLEAMPMTPSGKLDRRALPDPVFVPKAFRPPRTPAETTVAAVFEQILGVDRVGLDDDFFALGGNSLVATRISARLGTLLNLEVPVRTLFEHPTVGALARGLPQGLSRAARPPVAGVRPEVVPLSYAQQRMWFLNQFDADAVHNLTAAIELRGRLAVAALTSAMADVLDRHEALRTRYPAVDGVPRQEVTGGPGLVEPRSVTRETLAEGIRAVAAEPFDVADEVPVRIALLRLGVDEHVLVIAVHHIAADGWSIEPLTRDLLCAYAARRDGTEPGWPDLPVQYADFALWQRSILGSEDDPESLMSRQIRFWTAELDGLPDALALPSDRTRPAVASGRGARHEFSIDAGSVRQLRESAQRSHASLFMALHAVFATVLSKLTGTMDIAVGTPVAGRGAPELDDLVGMFVNTLVLRADIAPALSFTELLAAVRDADLRAFAHAELPFERLVEILNPARSRARHPLFQVMLDLREAEPAALAPAGMTATRLDIGSDAAKFDLHLILTPRPDGGLTAAFEYATDLFDAPTVAGFARRLVLVMDRLTARAEVPIGELDLLTDAERARMLTEWNDTGRARSEATLAALFQRQVERTPDAPAVTFEDVTLSYRELAERANGLARHLIALGAGPGECVALALRRSVDLVVGIYAITLAGAAYVPLDPDHPAARNQDVLDTARPVCVLRELPDVSGRSTASVTDAERRYPLRPSNTAYVLFTSGSTGRPKGVAVSHAAIVNRLLWMQSEYGLAPDDVVLQKTPVTFDVSVWELFWPLQIGARLVVAAPDGHRDPVYLAGLIAAAGVTVTHFVPSMLAVFVAEESVAHCTSLRMVFASGEALAPGPAQRLRALTGARVHNLYGPTEAAVDVTRHEVVDGDTGSVPIGRPVFNTRVYVLDGRLRPVPVGVAGELYLAGVQLAQGYSARPDLSAERFVANPFGVREGGASGGGSRMYRTGDLVRWTEDGELEYLGRTDFQVKLRGLRIELGEIESALTALGEVAQSVVVVRGGEQLVAYVIAAPAHSIEVDEVRARLSERLPAYMVPAVLIVLDEFPLTAAGKLDRRALPAPVFEAAAFRAPETPVQETVAGIFGDLLELDKVGADDDFFVLGGNSLLAARVVARLGAALGARIPVRVLFDAPTVAGLAARAEAEAGQRHFPALAAGRRPARIPLSPAQQRMWFLNRYRADDPDAAAAAVDNIPLAIRLTGALDVESLRAAIADVVARHETLRTTYPDGPDGPEQIVGPASEHIPTLWRYESANTQLAQQITDFARTGFDLTRETSLRAALLRLDRTEHVLVLVLHHIGADGFSLGPLARDLLMAYRARHRAHRPAWDELPVQYVDYTLWQAGMLGAADDPDAELHRQLDYWRITLADLPERLALPTDRPHPAAPSYRSGTHRLHIDSDLHGELGELARKYDATLFSTVHAALAVLLARLSGATDIAIGTPVAGRGDAALDDLVGMFVNTLVLRTEIDPRSRFDAVLDAVRRQDISALSHADVPFERLVEALAPARTAQRHPLFQVALTFQNFTIAPARLDGLTVRPEPLDAVGAKFDLQFTVLESRGRDGRSGGMIVEITYATDLFDGDTIAVLARRFEQVLSAVAADGTVVVGDIRLLSAEEQHLALYEWAVTGSDESRTDTLTARFARAAADRTDAVAIRSDGLGLTYGDLEARSNRLARRLIAAGVGPESLVAVALPRSAELVVALLAVLKAGGGYLPVDPDYPADRIGFVLDDARPVCAVTSAGAGLPAGWFTGPIVDVHEDACDGSPITDADRRAPLHPGNTAYVIYTSGSTGRPKGVVVPHRGVITLLDNAMRRFDFGPSDVWTLFHSFAFDFSVWELWGALLHGGTVVVVDYFTSRSPQQFRDLLLAERVTVLNQTPSAFYQLAAADLAEPPADHALRYVIFGGETLEPRRLRGWSDRYGRTPRLVDMYGITETTVHVTHRPLIPDTDVTGAIGGALPGLSVRLLDSRLRPVPVGVPGEIYVSGGQLARGYLHRPALTAARFVADPYGRDGALAYRSGDLARWTRDGELEYLGRADQQVNLRGFRIELGEIEAALLDDEAIGQAAVLLREESGGVARLVGYLVADGEIDPRRIRRRLGERLPEHMVPDALVVVDRIPLTVNGKLDRAALPAPEFEAAAYRRPATLTEQLVAQAYAQVLGGDAAVGADDDFFARGGTSLLAAKAVARIGAAVGARVPVRAVFEAPRVADLAARIGTDAGPRPPLVARERPRQVPLSPAQQRMWFLNRFDRTSTAYNIPLALRLTGRLDIEALRAAVADLVERHETLRTRYPETADGPTQLVVPAEQAVPAVAPVSTTDAALPQQLRSLAATTFDVTAEIPVRIELFARGEGTDEHVLAGVLHHICADGSSIVPFVRDLMAAYAARRTGEPPTWTPLPVHYADYALWQRELLGSEDDPESVAARQLEFWTTTLAGLPDQLDLPTDLPRPAVRSLRGATLAFDIDADLHARLTDVARTCGATLFMVVHAAFAAWLARLSRTGDIAVGTPVDGRNDPALDGVIGMFVNTVVLRTAVDEDDRFTDLLDRVRAADIAALSQTDIPFERLVEVLNPQRSTARHPLVQVGLSFHNHERESPRLPGLTVSPIETVTETAQFDLHLFAVDNYGTAGQPAGIALALGYATDLFTEPTARRLIAQLCGILETVAAQPHCRISELDLLGTERDLLAGWNATEHPVPPGTLTDLIDRQVAATPQAIALIDAIGDRGETLTYGEFDARVNRLARHLMSLGARPETTVALHMRRSVDLVIAMYAVVKAGAAYVPIDPDHPADRIRHILDTAAPIHILTTLDGLDLSGYSAAPVADADRHAPLRPSNTAYLIFTSGSTGIPKGVAVPHAAVVNQLRWVRARFGLGGADCALLKAPATFDLSVWEFWASPTTGGRLVVTAPGTERDPDRLGALLERHGVTVLYAVPVLLGMLLATDAALPASLRAVLAIGEVLPPSLATEFARRGPARLYNLYGPTETAVAITAFEVDGDPGHTVPIGGPVWNSRAHVLDHRLRPVPIGVPGELYLAGAQLARGYHDRSAETAARFVARPAGRMYRTGDIVRRRADGGLEYLDRADFQIKVGGFRIEPGEIETALMRRPGVTAAVAVAHRDPEAGSRLIAYVAVPHGNSTGEQLRRELLGELPRYLVPATVVVLDALPLNANGKVDRSRLPEPVFTETVFRAPGTATERLVAASFAELTGIAAAGLDDDFFALGGNSLLATRLAARLAATLRVDVPVSAIFTAPTVGALAALVESAESTASEPILRRRSGSAPAPLSPAQQRMWVLNRLAPSSAAYNVPVALRLRGALDIDALGAAIADVLGRHEILRTRYPERPGGPVQQVVPMAEMRFDLLPKPVAAKDIGARIGEFGGAGFDVTVAPPIRMAVLCIDPTDHIVVVVVHHICADGFSMEPLTRDLITAYTARSVAAEPAWSPLPIQYADYSEWHRETVGSDTDPDSRIGRQLAYWIRRLADAPEVLDLPTDRPRPARRAMACAALDFEVGPDLSDALAAVARTHRTTLFTVLHTAFAVLLAKLSGVRDLTLGVPVAGRGRRELDEMIGMFVNTVALRTELDPRGRFDDLLRRTRDHDLAALSNADVPFERVVEALGRRRTSAYTPLFQVLFTFANMPAERLALPGLTVEALDLAAAEAKYDLQLTAFERGPAGLGLRFDYATDIFDAATIRLHADRLLRVLAVVAADPAITIRGIDIRAETERAEPVGGGLADLPAAIAAAAPEAIALSHDGREITFAALHAQLILVRRALGGHAAVEAVLHVALAGLVPGLPAAVGADGLTRVLHSLRERARGSIRSEGIV
ncbi:non-ribosomal peptide synthase/polyketide synthase [Nocardia sp. NPDC051570]|uniref:non-ribosomal peptide synthase/polyketide synthase n=1 Tax=Nocardia sp. NPDC051570 TaxID=3364324 RepID=UPI00378C6F4A